jgi:hypothetical protein
MSEIFISYVNEDRLQAKIIAEALEHQGYSVWWDVIFPPGKTFDDVIKEELDSAKCIIVLWSRKSVLSNWVKEESSEGVNRNILIPVLIDDVKIPLGFRQIQAAQLIDWSGTLPNPEFDLLLKSVTELVEQKQPPEVTELVELKQPPEVTELVELKQPPEVTKLVEQKQPKIIVCFCKVAYFSPMCLQREFELALYVSQLKKEIKKIKCKESIKTSPIEKITFVEQGNKKFLIIKIISAVCDISPYEREIRFTETINSVNFKILPKIIGNFNINIEIYYDEEKINVFKIPIEIKEKPIEMPLNGLCTIKVTEKQVLSYAIIGTFASILSINLTYKGLGLLFMVLLVSYILLKRRPSKIIKEEDFSFTEII